MPKLSSSREWFKDAIFYEVYVSGFYDSDGDGVGDFRGLTAKLDYLEWLGIDCIWLLPFYESPLKDGGYDIADYYAVLPEYGTIDDGLGSPALLIYMVARPQKDVRVPCGF